MRLSPAGRLLPLALALGLALAGCRAAGTSATASTPEAPSPATPSTAVAANPSLSGPAPSYPVATRTLALTDPSRTTDAAPGHSAARHGRDLPTTLWYPSSGAGPFPVVMFSHGFTGLPSDNATMLSSWAAAGFVVAAPAFPLTRAGSAEVTDDVLNQPADVTFVLTQVLALDHTAGDDLAGRIDGKRIAAAGFSAGAITTIGLLDSCCADPRLTAALVLEGSPRGFGLHFRQPGVPTLVVHGTADQSLPYTDGEQVYAALPGPKAFVTLPGADHTGPWENPADSHFPAATALTTDFLRWALAGQTDALLALRKDADRAGVAQLTDDRLG